MQSISSSSCFRIPIPNRVSLTSQRRLKYRPTTLSLSTSVSTFSIHLTTRSSSGKEDETQKNDHHPVLHLSVGGGSDEVETPEPQFQEPEQQSSPKRRGRKSIGRGIFTSMWWADLRAAFGQRFNWEGILCFSSVLSRDQHLVLPHVAVRDVRHIDWAELQRRGFKGVVFDKDNTITAPYCLTLWGSIAPSIEQCKSVFGHNIAIFSNSAGKVRIFLLLLCLIVLKIKNVGLGLRFLL